MLIELTDELPDLVAVPQCLLWPLWCDPQRQHLRPAPCRYPWSHHADICGTSGLDAPLRCLFEKILTGLHC